MQRHISGAICDNISNMIIVMLVLLGLCFGSFVNALVWRIHEQSKPKSKRAAGDKALSIAHGRSMCPNCHHTLMWYDLLPLVSWISLAGKCRYCHKAISWQYPAVELITAFTFVLSYVYWPIGLNVPSAAVLFGLWLVFLVAFIALAVYDLRWMILPNRIVFPLQALAVIYLLIRLAAIEGNIWTAAVAPLLSVLCSAGLFYLLFQISDGRWIGGGDVKLAVVIGLILGDPALALLMLFIASSMGSLVGIPLLLRGKAKKDTKLPFGPFLIASTIVTQLFGAVLIAWYKNHFLIV